MRIDKVIHASDDKEFYLDFWPIVSKIWRKKFNIEPVLLYFGNGSPSEEFGTVIKISKANRKTFFKPTPETSF